VVVERHLQARLTEVLAASVSDPTGGLAIAGILLEMWQRNRRPFDAADFPQLGDLPVHHLAEKID